LQTSEALFRNLKNAKRFAIDIGGSLTKIAYFSTVSHRRIRSRSKSPYNNGASESDNVSVNSEFEYDVWEGARLHFIKFETLFIEECLDFIQKHLAPLDSCGGITGKRIKATGKKELLN
jgi:pantothenate kinase